MHINKHDHNSESKIENIVNYNYNILLNLLELLIRFQSIIRPIYTAYVSYC
jgi:hypothetical protein